MSKVQHTSQQEITYTVDEKLNVLSGKNLAPQKLARANKMLRNIKNVPPSLNLGALRK